MPSYVDGPFWQADFYALNGVGRFSHMSGLLSRKGDPLALMKFERLGPDHCGELCAHDG
jgi:hypothetical protein